jgi:DNA-binding MarR family transcriptional regulator
MVKDSGQPERTFGPPPVPAGLRRGERHETANALHSAALRLLRHVRTADGEMDLDGPRASALSVLVFAGPMPLGRLADLEQVTPPAMTKTVTALETAGLVERVRSASDRRVVLVRATAQGRAVLERGRAARVRLIATLLDRVSERDRRTVGRAAQIIGRALAGGR